MMTRARTARLDGTNGLVSACHAVKRAFDPSGKRPRGQKPNIALAVIGVLAALAMMACSLGAAPTATPTPTPVPSNTPTATAVPPTATAAATATATVEPPTATASTTPVPAIILAVAGLDHKIVLVTTDGQSVPLAQAPGVLYALANLSSDPGAMSKAYSIGPQGVTELPFVNHSSEGFASFTGACAPQGEVAWDHYAAASGSTVNSEIFVANSDGSNLRSVLKLSGDHVLHVVRFSTDGQRLFFSQEPLGLGGYILFSGVSNLSALDLASGGTTQLVPDAAAGTICLDDFAPDVSLVALHCNQKSIDVLDTTTGTLVQIAPPAAITDWQVHGDVRLSPDQSRVAYALARGDPNNEQGWVAVSDGLTGTSRLVATAPAGDYYSVKGWLNATTLVLQSWGAKPGVWVVQADGSDLRRVTDGFFLGGG